ncbi:MAG: hypothetical protein AAGA69_08870, partial [Pseudomonadota bacterium]
KKLFTLMMFMSLGACSGTEPTAQDAFFDNLSALCGQAFAGELVSDNDADAELRGQPMVMHVRECSDTVIRIPFHIGDDRSRTWVITRGDGTLTLKHDHRHEDGEEDVLTQYGGTTDSAGTATRQEFPADQFSKDLFTREGIPVSNDNVWAVEVTPGEMYAYELSRPNRFFRAEFDLSAPVEAPPPPWGFE